jgi:hypothetical protein
MIMKEDTIRKNLISVSSLITVQIDIIENISLLIILRWSINFLFLTSMISIKLNLVSHLKIIMLIIATKSHKIPKLYRINILRTKWIWENPILCFLKLMDSKFKINFIRVNNLIQLITEIIKKFLKSNTCKEGKENIWKEMQKNKLTFRSNKLIILMIFRILSIIVNKLFKMIN